MNQDKNIILAEPDKHHIQNCYNQHTNLKLISADTIFQQKYFNPWNQCFLILTRKIRN